MADSDATETAVAMVDRDRNGKWPTAMAKGGVLSGPTSGYMAELHGTEAVVPLPDGTNIPVQLSAAESKSMPELVQINRNLLQQNYSLNEKIERLIRATEESNTISRNSAYARA
jgi:hypothetical protein